MNNWRPSKKTRLQPGQWEWIAKKPPEYCRIHGERICGNVNGIWACRKCADPPREEASEKS